MRVHVVPRGPDSPDLVRDLFAWLIDEPELRGRVHIREHEPPSGALGPMMTALEVSLGSGGASTAFATAAVTWLRHRTGKVVIAFRNGEGHLRLELTANRVRKLDAEALQSLVVQVAEALSDEQPQRPGIEEGDGHHASR